MGGTPLRIWGKGKGNRPLLIINIINKKYLCVYLPQSRQRAKLFLQSSELGLPQPLARRRVRPPPP